MLLELEAVETGIGLRRMSAERMLVLIVTRMARAEAIFASYVRLLKKKTWLTIAHTTES